MCVFPTICIAQIIAKICKQRNVGWLGRFGLHTFDVRNDFSTGKHWAQISSNFLAEFAEIFLYSVGRPLIFERQDNSNS